MSVANAILLGVLQGLTEFLPVSSTAHLVLVQKLLHIDVEGLLSFDIVLHLGTALALIVVFWRDLAAMARETGRAVVSRPAMNMEDRKMILPLVVGTIPGVAAGILLLKKFEAHRTTLVVGFSMIAACIYFFLAEGIADARAERRPERDNVSVLDSLWIGLAQAAAGLLAGFSRSGMTIATGRLRGIERQRAARFSFLLALIIILGAGAKTVWDLHRHPQPALSFSVLAAGFSASAIVGFGTVRFLLRYLKLHSLRPFGAYLGLLGAALVILSLR